MTKQPLAETFVDSADLYHACGSADHTVQAARTLQKLQANKILGKSDWVSSGINTINLIELIQ